MGTLTNRVEKLEATVNRGRFIFLKLNDESGDDGLTTEEALARRGKTPGPNDFVFSFDGRSPRNKPGAAPDAPLWGDMRGGGA